MERPKPREADKKLYYDVYIPNSINGGYGHSLYETLNEIIEQDTVTPIRFKIDTYGGNLSDIFEVARMIEQTPNPVITQAGTKCDSGGILLVACGDQGARYAPSNCEFIAHQVQYTIKDWHGSAPDFFEYAKEKLNLNREFMRAIAAKSKQPVSAWLAATQKDYKFGAVKARDHWGIIDQIIYPKKGQNGKR